MKLSTGKETLPGRKQVFRQRNADGFASRDVIARADEQLDGDPLLELVMRNGERLDAGRRTVAEARGKGGERARTTPGHVARATGAQLYPVAVSAALQSEATSVRAGLLRG